MNGLLDGWNHSGFHSHPFPDGKGGPGWWKFDLPPDWEPWVGASSLQRCAWQWRSAHAAILDFLRQDPTVHRHTLHFEDLLQGGEVQADAVRGLSRWLGVELPVGLLDGVPAVMATAPPRRRRWFARVVELGPVLEDPLNVHMMKELGYGSELASWL